jgi:cytochrome c551/c552
MLNIKVILIILFSVLLASCGQQSNQTGDSAAGKELFHQTTIDSAPGCMTCHSTQPDKVIVGPSLAGIANRAGGRVPGQTAEEYLRNSILDPNLYIVDKFSSGLMYQNYEDVLTEKQINDLIAYLSTVDLQVVRP